MATLTFYTAHVQISHVGCVWAAEMLQGAVLVFVVCLLAAPGGLAEDCCVKVDTSTKQLVDVNGQTALAARLERLTLLHLLPSLCVFGLQVEPASSTESMW